MYRHRTAYSLGAVALFSAVVLAANARGVGSRVFSPTRTAHVVGSPAEAASIWLDRAVRGRTLLLFGDFPHDIAFGSMPGAPPPSSELVRWAIFHDVVRRIYLVVPDARWDELARRPAMYRPLREAPGIPGAQVLFTLSGVPLIAVRLSSLPAIRETALVYVDDGVFDSARIVELLTRRGISADITVTRRRGDGP